MNVSYRWLEACTDDVLGSPDEIAERLAARGFPVEGMRDLGAGLASIVVARVRDVGPHPNADRLRVCEVDGGSGVVQVVCGAPNVQPGGLYPFAPVGATLPGGTQIGKVKLRGEVSEGMLCSERELGLGPGAAGLMELQAALEPGAPLVEALGLADVRMDVEVTANRSDLLSHLGVAREVAPNGDASLSPPEIPGATDELRARLHGLEVATDERQASGAGVTLRVEEGELCTRYLGLAIRGVSVGPSPAWLSSRLRAIGLRPINNVVDATNYVLHELGQPLHAFDLDRLQDRTIVVRRAASGEKLTTLDGVERALSSSMLAICDAAQPVAVAGVMGGRDSEVGATSTDIFLECALFAPGPIRATRKALGISTDASYRFERGVDPEGQRRALLRTAEIILATAGGAPVGPILDVRPVRFARSRIALRNPRITKLLGVSFETSRVRALLEPLGFVVDGDGPTISVEVPGFRSYDVTREVDLIEEVARTHGYDAFPDTLGPFRTGTVPDHPLFRVEDAVRDELVAHGVLEAQTPAFAPEGEGEVEISNPVSAEEGFLRSRLLPGLLRRLQYNLARGNRDVRLFEIGTVFRDGEQGRLPDEETRVACVLHGRRRPPHWSSTPDAFDIWDLKGVLERVTKVGSEKGARLDPAATGEPGEGDPSTGSPTRGFASDASFLVRSAGGEVVGAGGRVPASLLDLPPWAGAVWGFELRLEPAAGRVPTVRYRPLPTQPSMDRDLALLVPAGVTVEVVLECIRTHGGEHLRDIRVFDVYRGDELPKGVRSVAVRLRFRAEDRTLEEREVESSERAVLRALEEELSVGIRGKQH